MSIRDDLDRMEAACREVCGQLKGAEDVEAIRVRFLGRKGELRAAMTGLKDLDAEEKIRCGVRANEVKDRMNALLAEARDRLGTKAAVAAAPFDPTMPGTAPVIGRKHPIYETMAEIRDIFLRMGFPAVEGPEVETPFNNFEALNIPEDHPSRDGFDSFYLSSAALLRSHTSPVQVRVMTSRQPPVRVIVPGKVYRPDTPDASHAQVFHQVEGLWVDEGVSFADLKGVLTVFARQFFGAGVRTRFRPSFFPFTEPSAEVDVSCILCGSEGCPACGRSGWLEVLGSGMVHPRVLENVGYDSEKYTGFAFGMGVERLAMLRLGVRDIRCFMENDLRFLAPLG